MSSRPPEVESREYYDKLAGEYDYAASYTRSPWTRYFHLRRRIGAIVNEINRAAASRTINDALDVGCGDGVLLPALGAASKRVLATDLSPERLESARERNKNLSNIEYLAAGLGGESFPRDRKFDLVTCSEVIEHVSTPEAFMAQLVDLLAPNGVLILSTPSKWSARENYLRVQQEILNLYFNKLRKQNVSKYVFFHIGLLSTKEVKALAAKYSRDVRTYTVGFYLPVVTEGLFTINGDDDLPGYEKLDAAIGRSALSWLNWTQILVLVNDGARR